jgi:hypothetical protein
VFLFFNLHKTILFTRSVMAPSKLNSTVIPLLSPSLSINNYILDFDLLCSVGWFFIIYLFGSLLLIFNFLFLFCFFFFSHYMWIVNQAQSGSSVFTWKLSICLDFFYLFSRFSRDVLMLSFTSVIWRKIELWLMQIHIIWRNVSPFPGESNKGNLVSFNVDLLHLFYDHI